MEELIEFWDSSKNHRRRISLSCDEICMWFWDGSKFELFSFSLISARKRDHVSKFWDGSLLSSKHVIDLRAISKSQAYFITWQISFDDFLSYLKVPLVFINYKSLSRNMNFVWQSESVKLPSMYRIQSKFWSWLPEPGRPFDHECFDQKVQVIKHSRTIQKYSKSFGRVPNFFRCSKMFRPLWKWIIYLIRNYYLVFYMNLLIDNRLKVLNCNFFHGGYV